MSNLFNSVKVLMLFGKEVLTRLITFNCIIFNICLSMFPFHVWDKLWVLIRPIPEVSLVISFSSKASQQLFKLKRAYLVLWVKELRSMAHVPFF